MQNMEKKTQTYDPTPYFDYYAIITWMQNNKYNIDKMKKYVNITEQLLGFQILPFFSEEASLILLWSGSMYSEKKQIKHLKDTLWKPCSYLHLWDLYHPNKSLAHRAGNILLSRGTQPPKE